MQLYLRRALLGLTSLASAASLVVAGSVAPAQAAVHPRVQGVTDWMAGQLTDGLLQYPDTGFGEYVDYGLTLDYVVAFKDLRTKAPVRAQIMAAVEPVAGSYVGSGGESYAGSLGKLLTAVQLDGGVANQYAGGGLVTRLKSQVVRQGAQKGRALDVSSFGEFSNAIGQAWVVQALARNGNLALARTTTAFLLKQQCRAGYFRVQLASKDFTCDSATGAAKAASVDATALAVRALRVARTAGVTGLGDDLADALGWLARQQQADGSFRTGGVSNANSTGLAAYALRATHPGKALKAARWVAGVQASAINAAGTPLESDFGALAYDEAALAAGREDGITDGTLDQWRRATGQAASALGILPRP